MRVARGETLIKRAQGTTKAGPNIVRPMPSGLQALGTWYEHACLIRLLDR